MSQLEAVRPGAQSDRFTIDVDGSGLRRITNDAFGDAVSTTMDDGFTTGRIGLTVAILRGSPRMAVRRNV